LKLKNKIKSIYETIYKVSFIEKPLPKYPFGNKIWATKQEYRSLLEEALNVNDESVKEFERQYGFSLNINWWSDLALHTQVVIKPEKLNFFHGRLLYSLLSSYISDLPDKYNDLKILETGTARGFSAICMAKALIDNKYPGFITTIDAIPHNQSIYWNCIDDLDGPRSRAVLLKKWSAELRKIIFLQGWTTSVIPKLGLERVNFAFLDAQHTKENVLNEFLYVFERQLIGDIIVFDDVTENIFPGVCEAVEEIENNYPYKVKRIKFEDNRGYAIATKII